MVDVRGAAAGLILLLDEKVRHVQVVVSASELPRPEGLVYAVIVFGHLKALCGVGSHCLTFLTRRHHPITPETKYREATYARQLKFEEFSVGDIRFRIVTCRFHHEGV